MILPKSIKTQANFSSHIISVGQTLPKLNFLSLFCRLPPTHLLLPVLNALPRRPFSRCPSDVPDKYLTSFQGSNELLLKWISAFVKMTSFSKCSLSPPMMLDNTCGSCITTSQCQKRNSQFQPSKHPPGI